MVSVHSFWPFRLSFVLFCLISHVAAAPWIVTDAYAEKVVTDPYYYYSSTVVTKIVDITPTGTSLPEPISTITSVATTDHFFYDAGDVTVVQELYPTGVGEPVESFDDDYYEDYLSDGGEYHYTVFKVNITYEAPTGCSTQWTTTTAAEVSPPRVVEDLLPRTAVETSTSVDNSEPFEPTTITYDVVFVDPTQVPSSSLEYISSINRPTSMYSGAGCGYHSDGDGSDYYNNDNDGYDNYDNDDNDGSNYFDWYDYYYGGWFLNPYWRGIGISPLALTLILLLCWIGIFFIAGLIEAFIHFRRIMTGWQARRGLPVSWSLMILPITLLLLFFSKEGYRSRSHADAEIMGKRWDDTSTGRRLRLFFIWGFRYQYPPMLGPAPALVKTTKQPDMNPGPHLLTPSPPGSEAERSAPRDSTQAEMAEPQLPTVPEVSSSQSVDHIGRAS